MNKIKKFCHHFFSQKKNWFLILLSFFLVLITTISANLEASQYKRNETLVNRFPNNSFVAKTTYNDFISLKSKLYGDYYTVYKRSETLYPDDSNIELPEVKYPKVNFYGITNAFFANQLFYEAGINDFDFTTFKMSSGKQFDDEDYEFSLNKIIIPNFYSLDSNMVKINNNEFLIQGSFEFQTKLSNKEINVFIPKSTFATLFSLMAGTDVIIYGQAFKEFESVLGSRLTVNKDKLIGKFNSLVSNSDSTMLLYTMLMASSLVSLIIVIFISIKNRTNEIGIKMAVGARKSDILFEFLNEISFGLIVGLLTGLLTGTIISFYIESFLTIYFGMNSFYINFSMMLFTSCLFYVFALATSLIPLSISVNSNIEMILKEER